MSRRDVYRSAGETRVLEVAVSVSEAFSANASNYHTFSLRHIRSGQSNGETVGSDYSLDTRSLSANEPVTIYTSSAGLAMSDGERLALVMSETGSPTALRDLEVWVRRQRIVR